MLSFRFKFKFFRNNNIYFGFNRKVDIFYKFIRTFFFFTTKSSITTYLKNSAEDKFFGLIGLFESNLVQRFTFKDWLNSNWYLNFKKKRSDLLLFYRHFLKLSSFDWNVMSGNLNSFFRNFYIIKTDFNFRLFSVMVNHFASYNKYFINCFAKYNQYFYNVDDKHSKYFLTNFWKSRNNFLIQSIKFGYYKFKRSFGLSNFINYLKFFSYNLGSFIRINNRLVILSTRRNKRYQYLNKYYLEGFSRYFDKNYSFYFRTISSLFVYLVKLFPNSLSFVNNFLRFSFIKRKFKRIAYLNFLFIFRFV